MVFQWLGMNTSKDNKQVVSSLIHEVLGTPIESALQSNEEEIFFGCGCFWGAEKAFWKLPGVITTAVGYAGGSYTNPNYKQVCTGTTGHSEVVLVKWNKEIIDISDLLKLFWECHDPTQGNRQGNDFGSQYRSAIFTNKDTHYKSAIDSMHSYQEELSKHGFNKITTEIKQNTTFYYAEKYHQQYLAKPGSRPYCSAMPTNVIFQDFPNSNFKLNKEVWSNFNWELRHCILRSDNNPIKQTS